MKDFNEIFSNYNFYSFNQQAPQVPELLSMTPAASNRNWLRFKNTKIPIKKLFKIALINFRNFSFEFTGAPQSLSSSPFGVAGIYSVIELFGLLYPHISTKHLTQLIYHFLKCLKVTKYARTEAVLVNIFCGVFMVMRCICRLNNSSFTTTFSSNGSSSTSNFRAYPTGSEGVEQLTGRTTDRPYRELY